MESYQKDGKGSGEKEVNETRLQAETEAEAEKFKLSQVEFRRQIIPSIHPQCFSMGAFLPVQIKWENFRNLLRRVTSYKIPFSLGLGCISSLSIIASAP